MSPVKGKLTCLSVIGMENVFRHLASENLPELLFFSRLPFRAKFTFCPIRMEES